MRFGLNLKEEEQKVYFEENSKCRKIYPDANGHGLYGEVCHDSQNPEERKIDFTTYGSRVIEENVKWSDIAPP